MNRKGGDEVQTSVLIIGEQSHRLELGSLPSDSTFYTEWEEVLSTEGGERLYVADPDSSRVRDGVKRWFAVADGDRSVEIMWNAAHGREFSYAMVSLAKEIGEYSLRILGEQAHLRMGRPSQGSGPLSSQSLESLEISLLEVSPKPTSISTAEIATFLDEHQTLIDELEKKTLELAQMEVELKEYRNAVSQLTELGHRVKELESENSELQEKNIQLADEVLTSAWKDAFCKESMTPAEQSSFKRAIGQETNVENEWLRRELSALQSKYNALAGSKLGSLTLKNWERRAAKKRES